METHERPVLATPESERLHALDAIRGAAILGVLLAYCVWNLGAPPEDTWTPLDHTVARGMDLFVDSKCYTLFACLFGLGVSQQWRRWQSAGLAPWRLHVRRMGFLLGVGALHALLLRNGDILVPYAVCGFALLGFRTMPNRALAAASVFALAAPWVIAIAAHGAGFSWPERPTGDSGNYLADNFAWVRYWYATGPLLYWPQTLGLMLLGVLLGRGRVVERLSASRKTPLVLAAALVLAFAARVMVDTFQGERIADWLRPAAGRALYELSSWSLAAAYGLGVTLLMAGGRATMWHLRAVGRMAFTNYLMQPVIIVPLCLAFGLFDTFTPTRGLSLALAVGALQMAWSAWWMRSHSQGPLEGVWRRATYGAHGRG
ncbi:MAG TPA: DUF418 domain-containing protein [Candidatus Eisenbacteria bacterium]|nr:DUF418 domain-containing protein [Candidatus Eisenbacteria bacterium]